ncbi:signal peptide peptidase SppA [uncultured Brachyspira sp.]|uniref:signal peptide peptidase SppA n=1 Tax=uncultured Brachyspira sp. TaxID=221953 RepID=UPI0025CC27B7|nr:signal peptide peptidase SppA [uncultured Brachyspira sp.]
MSYEEEKENQENSSIEEKCTADEKNKIKKEERSKRELIFTSLIIISIIVGIISIFVKGENKTHSIQISNNINSSISSKAVLKDGIAVIDLTGMITHTKRKSNIGLEYQSVTEKLIEDFEYYIKHPKVKAIVLQVDSPGGSLTSCEETLKYLQNLKAKYPKPIVASFRSLAASGGYYISMIADKIYANESTLTGSIGVIAQFFNVSELMGKYGVKMYTIKSGRNKDSLSPFREPRQDELDYWQAMTEEFIAQFTNVVEQSRGSKIKGNRDDVFDGRIFSGKKALEIGLVDAIGTLQDAVKDAAEMGGIKDEEPYIIKKPEVKNNVMNLLFSNISETIKPKSKMPIPFPYEEILNTKYVGVPMYIYIPNYIGEN